MEKTVQEINEMIDRVIPLLDAADTAWRSKIDLTRFDAWDPDRCVLFYVFGSWVKGMMQLFGPHPFNARDADAFADPRGEPYWRERILERGEVE
jgi:hypothetical protein